MYTRQIAGVRLIRSAHNLHETLNPFLSSCTHYISQFCWGNAWMTFDLPTKGLTRGKCLRFYSKMQNFRVESTKRTQWKRKSISQWRKQQTSRNCNATIAQTSLKVTSAQSVCNAENVHSNPWKFSCYFPKENRKNCDKRTPSKKSIPPKSRNTEENGWRKKTQQNTAEHRKSKND